MSYILDALKKSDQQRQRGSTPTLQAAQLAVAAPRRPALFYYGLFAAVLLAGVMIGLLRPWQADQLPSGVEPVAIPQHSAQESFAAPQQISGNTSAKVTEKDAMSDQAAPAPEKISKMTEVAQVQPVLSLDELPFAIQREIPAMAVQLHAYSGVPGERLVSINSVRLREGGSLMSGLRLEQITPDGMIFSYKGYHFRRGIR